MMIRRLAALATILLLLSPADGGSEDGAAAPQGATLVVRVVLRGAAAPSRTLEVARDRETCGETATTHSMVVDPATRGLRDAAVWIDAPPLRRASRTAATIPPASLTNRGCRFEPPMLLAQVGGRIEVRNDDPILHNTHIAATDRTFLNIAMPAGTPPVAKLVREEGVLTVQCDAHPFMRAAVLALDHDVAAATGAAGLARIAGLPPGLRTVRVWHAALGELARQVVVPEQGLVTVTFEYGG